MKIRHIFLFAFLCHSLAATAQLPTPVGANSAAPAHVEIELSAVEFTFPQDKTPLDPQQLTWAEIEKLPQKSVRVLDHASGTGKSGSQFFATHIINPAAAPANTTQKSDPTMFAPGESGTIVELEPAIGGQLVACDVNIVYHLRIQTDAHDPHTLQEINFITSFTGGFQKPVIVSVSAIQGREGTFIAIIATLHLADANGKPAGSNVNSPKK